MDQNMKKFGQNKTENNDDNEAVEKAVEKEVLNQRNDNPCKREEQSCQSGTLESYENKDSEKLKSQKVALNTKDKNLCSKGIGRKYITMRHLPHGTDGKVFRKTLNIGCSVISMGTVRVNNIGWTLVYLQFSKENDIERIYRAIKVCEKQLY